MQKINYPDIFENFVGREHDLRQVIRFHIYDPMYYRSNLFTHSKRVLWLLQSILPLAEELFGDKFDSTKAQLMAAVHDDFEIVMGDVQAGHKIKMTPAQLSELSQQEDEAIEKIAERFPYTVLGYKYLDLLVEGQELKTLEAKLFKYIDRFDSFGESLHEIYAGNLDFTINRIDEDLGVIPLPVVSLLKWLPFFSKNNPEFAELFTKQHPLFVIPANFDTDQTVRQKIPHTKESILKNTQYEPYNVWKKIILESGDQEEINNLYHQKEFATLK